MNIPRSVKLYHWKDDTFVVSQWETTGGLRVETEPLFTVPDSTSAEELGAAIIQAIECFRTGREHPVNEKEWKSIPDPLLKATGLKNRLPIWQDGEVVLVSERPDDLAFFRGSRGRARNSYVFEGQPLSVPRGTDPHALGEATRKLFRHGGMASNVNE